MPTFNDGQRVQVKNSHSGHWVYAEIISTKEDDGIVVRYDKKQTTELVKESRVRLPIPKKNHSKKKGSKVTTTAAAAVAANAAPSRFFERTVQPILEPINPAVSVHQPRKETLGFTGQAPEAPKAPSVPSSRDRAQIVLNEVEKGLDAARLKREAIDNEIAALSARKASLETYIKLDEEFSR